MNYLEAEDRLAPFDPSHAGLVLSWAQNPIELAHWASLMERPTPGIFDQWLASPGVHGRLLLREVPIAYGEIWVAEAEDEVELGHLLVSPANRGQGVGRELVQLLVEESASFLVSVAWVRVVPENEAALRCYSGAGFAPVSAAREAEFNSVQPREYRWLSRNL